MRISMIQPNLKTGDIQGNAQQIISHYQYANSMNCDLVIAPEMALSGYNIEDLALNTEFIEQNKIKLYEIAQITKECNASLLIGHLWPQQIVQKSQNISNNSLNMASFIEKGWIIHQHVKQHLANYDVFNEERIFAKTILQNSQSINSLQDIKSKNILSKNTFDLENFKEHNNKEINNFSLKNFSPKIFRWKQFQIGIFICEDMWHDDLASLYYDQMKQSSSSYNNKFEKENQIENIFIVINGSPYSENKVIQREKIAQSISQQYKIPLLYINQFGGQDHLIFDGGSFVLNKTGSYEIKPVTWFNGSIIFDLLAISLTLKESSIKYISRSLNLNKESNDKKNNFSYQNRESFKEVNYTDMLELNDIEGSNRENLNTRNIYQAIMQGIYDYVRKSNFTNVIIGLSGGIDSALVATMACDALGPDNVQCVALPSQYSSNHSIKDADTLCKNLQCAFDIMPINTSYNILHKSLEELLGPLSIEITTENLQARIRGILLMGISNKKNALLLCCSNKSESAVGYSTIYGDLCGAFAPLADVYKSQIYNLAKWRNKNYPVIYENDFELNANQKLYWNNKELIPEAILNKEPSAELKPDQKDIDTLPPYDILDKILYCLIEENLSIFDTSDLTKQNILLVKRIHNMLIKQEFKRKQFPCFPQISEKPLVYSRRYPITNYFS